MWNRFYAKGLKHIYLNEGKKIPYPNHYFTVITCLDVLEHVVYDTLLLKEFGRVLKENGYLIVFAPAFNILWSALDIRSHHVRRYSKSNLHKKLYKSGFRIVEL